MNLYVIYDRVAQESGPVFEAKNDGIAVRQMRNVLSENPASKPLEYQLLNVGTIDHETNVITPIGTPLDVSFSLEEVL